MGRSFSVYLFCLAMDPVFHYLNRIPGVISVQGYVDDTTIVGLTEDPSWLRKVSTCYGRLKSAGFVVDGHSCYRSCLNSCMKYSARVVPGDELLQYWPQVDHARGYPTVTAALEHTAVRGYSVLVLRLFGSGGQDGGVLVNLSFQQVLEVCQGRDYAPVLPLLAQSCTCKSKCSVVTNCVLRTRAMSALETAGYGAHSVVSQALYYSPGGALQKMVAGKGSLNQLTCPPSMLDPLASSVTDSGCSLDHRFLSKRVVLPLTPLLTASCFMPFPILESLHAT